MIFLNPAVLFGLLAASIPVLIHLLNLRKLKRVEFSTLAFLKELQKNKIRKIKLKQWLLLALRVLIILFIVMAFARPTLKGIAIGGTTSAAKTTAVFILDNTFSMSVVNSKGSYFNQAKADIKQVLNLLQDGDEVALVLVGDNNTGEVKPTTNLSDFTKKLDAEKISDASGFLNNALVQAAKILSKSNNFNKEIYIFSDFQANRIVEANSISNLSELLNDKVRIFTFNLSGKNAYNLGISDLKLNTQIFEKNKPLDFVATVSNYSEQAVNNLVVSLFIDGQRSAQQSVSIQPGESKVVDLQANVNSYGYFDAFAEIEDDDILQDNKRYISFFIPKEIHVGIFSDDPNDAKYVNLALFAGNSDGTLQIDERNSSQLSSINLSQYDALIIFGSPNISNPGALISFANNGGGLFLIPASNGDISSFQKITAELNLPKPLGIVGKLNTNENAVRFDKTDFNHPIFQDLYSNQSKKNIESPEINFHYKYSTEGKGESVISLTDGSSFLSDYKIGKGKILVLNTSPVLSWSNFPLKAIFAPLMNKSVFYLASKNNEDNNFIAGGRAIVNINDNTSPQIKIENPDKSDYFINLQDRHSLNYVEFDKTNVAGNYKIFSGEKEIGEFSVNVDPAESITNYLSMSEFEKYLQKIGFKGKFIDIGRNSEPAKIITQARYGSELWRYFLLIAIIFALVEMFVAKSSKKEIIND
jgi:uncharacterized membrane protein